MRIEEVGAITIVEGDALESLAAFPDQSVNCCVTSPPYWGLRDYGVAGQLGLESTPQEYVEKMVAVFREVRRVLRDDGTLWLNLGDSYASSATKGGSGPNGKNGYGEGYARAMRKGSGRADGIVTGESPRNRDGAPPCELPAKNLIGIPWRVAFALQADGWWLRQDIIWAKSNPMPESVRDRCTKSHEYIFLLAKSEKYYCDMEAIAEPQTRSTLERAKYGWRGRTDDNSNGARTGSTFKRMAESGEPIGTIPADGMRNKRSVWTVSTKPYKEAHFATFPPDLIEPCILAGCSPAGKRCDCDVVIDTPTGSVESDDPSMETGRAGMNRPRGTNEGVRPITRREQRWHAMQMRESPHRAEMASAAGRAFDHYIRTDASGARPLPEILRVEFTLRGWITDAPPCAHPIESAGIVLDPFGGSGTTGMVAQQHGRRAILLELNPTYVDLAVKRITGSMMKATV